MTNFSFTWSDFSTLCAMSYRTGSHFWIWIMSFFSKQLCDLCRYWESKIVFKLASILWKSNFSFPLTSRGKNMSWIPTSRMSEVIKICFSWTDVRSASCPSWILFDFKFTKADNFSHKVFRVSYVLISCCCQHIHQTLVAESSLAYILCFWIESKYLICLT